MQQDFDIELGTGKEDIPSGVGQGDKQPFSKQTTGTGEAGAKPGESPAARKSMLDRLDITRSTHPVVCVFHILFKTSAIVASVGVFILVTILLCCDFWTVKNVTGRILVGLRWWTAVDLEGHEKWHFESHDTKIEISSVDSAVFWWTQIGATGVWTLFLVWRILTILQLGFFWAALSLLGFFFTGTNTYAYFKCNKDYNKKLKGAMTNFSNRLVTSAVMSKYGMGLFK